jgi:acyl-CoA reductase-like NAD-dependent aldehyde dehydrogenase
MIHEPAYNRINKFIDQAKSEGHQIVGGQTDAGKRKIGLTCIRMKGEDSEAGWMKEEIFGPILPIVPIKVSSFLLKSGRDRS